jgi:hypothetical protein
MTRAFFTLIGYATVFILGLGICSWAASGAPIKPKESLYWNGPAPVLNLIPPTIHRKCPCWMYQADGFIELAPGGTDTVGPDSTDYSGGHWSSDGAVSFANRPPKTQK